MHSNKNIIYLCGMNGEKKNTQMRKGVIELCILSMLSKGELYSSDLLSQLKEAELIVVEGTIYPLLTRLKNEGFLKYRWEESTGGPPRKYYSLTNAGKERLNNLKTQWNELVQSVNKIIEQ